MARNLLLRLLTALGVVVALVGPVFAAALPVTGSSDPDPVTIDRLEATFDVSKDGVMTARETITATFPYGRHGIFRYWDLRDTADRTVRYPPKDVQISLDGRSVPVEWQWEQGRRFRVAKIGDPDSLLPEGEHTYVIAYRIDGVLGPNPGSAGDGNASWTSGDSERSEFVWQVIPAGWRMAITQADVTVNLPAAPDRLDCLVGDGRACTVSDAGGPTLSVKTTGLRPNTPVTLRAAMDLPVPDRRHVPWSIAWDTLLGRNLAVVLIAAVLAVFAAIAGWLAARSTTEREPGFPVVFEPPEGLGPVQTYYVAHEHVPARAMSATLMHLAERKLVSLTQTGSGWRLTNTSEPADWDHADPVARELGEQLDLTRPGSTFEADGSVTAGSTLSQAKTKIPATTTRWARSANAVVSVPSEWLWRLLFVVAVIGTVVGSVFGQPWLAFPCAAFVIGAAPVWRRGVGSRRTPTVGRDLWSRAGGFERFLSTDSAQDRFDFSGREELYTDYIPYAVAFGVADHWARKYEVSTGQTAPMPLWYGGGVHTSGTGFYSGGDAFDSFESSLSSSISAYAATQSSSSSGGGGFSGGGGGGGGGGSW